MNQPSPARGRLLCACLLLAAGASRAGSVERLPLAVGKFPISAGVTLRAGTDLVFLSGVLPPVADPSKPTGSTAADGDMQTQTVGALTQIGATPARMGWAWAMWAR